LRLLPDRKSTPRANQMQSKNLIYFNNRYDDNALETIASMVET
jgi:hypothetical protein